MAKKANTIERKKDEEEEKESMVVVAEFEFRFRSLRACSALNRSRE